MSAEQSQSPADPEIDLPAREVGFPTTDAPVAEPLADRLAHVIDDEPADPDGEPVPADPDQLADVEAGGAADDLDGLHIRRVASIRRSLYRSRSHAVIASVTCAVGAAEVARMGMTELARSGGAINSAVVALGLVAAALVFGAGFTARRAVLIHRDLR